MTDSSSLQLGFTALEQTAARDEHRALIAQLIPIAQGLARMAGARGVTVADVRTEAVRQCILPASSRGRQLAFLGAVMKRAGLVSTEDFRRSDVDASHGNLHRVWKAP